MNQATPNSRCLVMLVVVLVAYLQLVSSLPPGHGLNEMIKKAGVGGQKGELTPDQVDIIKRLSEIVKSEDELEQEERSIQETFNTSDALDKLAMQKIYIKRLYNQLMAERESDSLKLVTSKQLEIEKEDETGGGVRAA